MFYISLLLAHSNHPPFVQTCLISELPWAISIIRWHRIYIANFCKVYRFMSLNACYCCHYFIYIFLSTFPVVIVVVFAVAAAVVFFIQFRSPIHQLSQYFYFCLSRSFSAHQLLISFTFLFILLPSQKLVGLVLSCETHFNWHALNICIFLLKTITFVYGSSKTEATPTK